MNKEKIFYTLLFCGAVGATGYFTYQQYKKWKTRKENEEDNTEDIPEGERIYQKMMTENEIDETWFEDDMEDNGRDWNTGPDFIGADYFDDSDDRYQYELCELEEHERYLAWIDRLDVTDPEERIELWSAMRKFSKKELSELMFEPDSQAAMVQYKVMLMIDLDPESIEYDVVDKLMDENWIPSNMIESDTIVEDHLRSNRAEFFGEDYEETVGTAWTIGEVVMLFADKMAWETQDSSWNMAHLIADNLIDDNTGEIDGWALVENNWVHPQRHTFGMFGLTHEQVEGWLREMQEKHPGLTRYNSPRNMGVWDQYEVWLWEYLESLD